MAAQCKAEIDSGQWQGGQQEAAGSPICSGRTVCAAAGERDSQVRIGAEAVAMAALRHDDLHGGPMIRSNTSHLELLLDRHGLPFTATGATIRR